MSPIISHLSLNQFFKFLIHVGLLIHFQSFPAYILVYINLRDKPNGFRMYVLKFRSLQA